MKAIYLAMALLVVFAAATFADEVKNCRLAVRTTFKSGKKKLDYIEIAAQTKELCKAEAKKREVASQDEDVEKVHVTFGYRELDSK